MIKEISPRWVKAMNLFHSKKYIQQVKEDIRLRPDIQEKIKGFEDSFIKFSALERVNFEADIDDELNDYLKRMRMYNTNVKNGIHYERKSLNEIISLVNIVGK